jgi:hypothetical protein
VDTAAAETRTMTGLWLLPWLRGMKAYVYGFPLVMMDLTREAAAAATVGEITAPPNRFSVMTHYPDASFRAVTRTGLDTLFAVAWADLDEEPAATTSSRCSTCGATSSPRSASAPRERRPRTS